MAIHTMHLVPSAFIRMKEGRKTVELRLYDEKRKQIEVGDSISFTSTESGEELLVEVIGLHTFASFDQLYKTLPLESLGYTKEEVTLASAKDMEEFYSPEKQKEHGVLGIEIRLIPKHT